MTRRAWVAAVALVIGCDQALFHDIEPLARPGDGSDCPTGAPTLDAQPDDEGAVRLTWSFDADIPFIVQRSERGGPVETIAEDVDGRELIDPGVRDRELTYQVRPLNLTCAPSNSVTVRTAPLAPRSVDVIFERDSENALVARVSWADPNRSSGHCFELTRVPAFEDGPRILGEDQTQVLDGPLMPESEYAYRVRTFWSCAERVLESDAPAEGTAVTPLGPVTDLEVTAEAARQIGIAWRDPNATTERFRVRRVEVGAPGTVVEVAVLDAETTQLDDADASFLPGQAWTYSVVAEGPSGASAPATIEASTTEAPRVELEAPTLERACRMQFPGRVTLDPRTAVATVSGTVTLPVEEGRRLPLMASSTGITVDLPDGALDLEALEDRSAFVAELSVLDAAGGEGAGMRSARLEPMERVHLFPVPTSTRNAPLASLTGQQPLVETRLAFCADCRGRQGSLTVGLQTVCVVVDGPVEGETRTLCWGDAASGQCGTGSTPSNYPNPRFVCDGPGPQPEPNCAPLADGIQVTGGQRFTCVRLRSGQVKCMGGNRVGSLGIGRVSDPAEPNEPFPRTVCRTGRHDQGTCVPLTRVRAMHASRGFNACALLETGETLCWGAPFPPNPSPPCEVGGVADRPCADPLTGVVALAGGNTMGCFVLEDGTVKCFGANERGQLGIGQTTVETNFPLRTVCAQGVHPSCSPLTDVVSVSGGLRHVCALRSGGEVWCWGDNAFGQLGNGDLAVSFSALPVRVCREGPGGACDPLDGAVSVAAGQDFTCVLLDDGRVECWGQRGPSGGGSAGANPLGDGLPDQPTGRPFAGAVCESGQLTPDGGCVSLGTGVRGEMVALSAGQQAACALSARGEVLCWGGQEGIDGPKRTLGHGASFGNATNPVPVCRTGEGDGSDCPVGSTLDDAAVRACRPLALRP